MKALLIACFCAAAGAQAAERTPFQVRCEDTISKTVSVLSSTQNGFTINNQLPFRALTAKAGNIDGRTQTGGLTITKGVYKASLGGPVLQDAASGYECIAPRVEIKLTYSPVLIYVGSEFAPGSCAYNEILAHEQRHRMAYMDNLARVELAVRDALGKRFEGKPLYAPSGTAMSALEHEINGTWFPFIRDEFEKAKTKQAEIDSPEEYARLGKACNGEISEIMLGHRK
jgi:hypothetical protein